MHVSEHLKIITKYGMNVTKVLRTILILVSCDSKDGHIVTLFCTVSKFLQVLVSFLDSLWLKQKLILLLRKIFYSFYETY